VTLDPGRGTGGRGSVAREAGGALTTCSGNAGRVAGRGPAGGGGLTTAGAGAAIVAPGVTTVAPGVVATVAPGVVATVAPGVVATVAPGVATGNAASQAGQNATTTATAARLTPPPTIHGHRTRGSESVETARGKYAAPRAGPPRCCSARLSASRM